MFDSFGSTLTSIKMGYKLKISKSKYRYGKDNKRIFTA